jgi:hypothetical protein
VGDLKTKDSITFNLSGAARIIWNFDEISLRKALLGLDEKALPTVLASYPSIDKAEAVIRPLWRSSFPDSEKEIKIVETLPAS